MKLTETYYNCIIAVTQGRGTYLVHCPVKLYEVTLNNNDYLDDIYISSKKGRKTHPCLPGVYRCNIEYWSETWDGDHEEGKELNLILKDVNRINLTDIAK